MNKNRNELIVELGTEELPNRFLIYARENLARLFEELLSQHGLGSGNVEMHCTPRRILFFAGGLESRQKDTVLEKQGPPSSLVFKDSVLTEAGKKFLASHGITVKNLLEKETKKGKYVFIRKVVPGKKTEEVIPEILPLLFKRMHLYKSMTWDRSGLEFIRPLRRITVVYNKKALLAKIGSLRSGALSYGHRTLGSGKPFRFTGIKTAKRLLKKHGVMSDPAEREKLITQQIQKLLRGKYRIRPNPDLLTEVVNLVERPFVQLCSFPGEFLSIPEEFISTCIVHHQRAFPVYEKNRLTGKFLIVLNSRPNANTRSGNERVLKARLNDTHFFFEEDIKQKSFEPFLQKLKKMLFLNDLGTLEEKQVRLGRLSDFLAGRLSLKDREKKNALRCAFLAKADLASSIVYEFPELQGIAGMIYARLFGEEEEVARGIADHYLPRRAGDEYPSSAAGIITGLADKMDHIAGAFIRDLMPTGSEDPFQVRRNSLALVNIIIRNKIHLSLNELTDLSLQLYRQQGLVRDPAGRAKNAEELRTYIKTRFRTVLSDMGYAHDEAESLLGLKNDDMVDLLLRAEELKTFRKEEKFKDLLTGLKRMTNIIRNQPGAAAVDPGLFRQSEEQGLYDLFLRNRSGFNEAVRTRDYRKAFEILAGYREAVDLFFDKVLVMAEDEKIRNNRLSLLAALVDDFRNLLDFSKIAEKNG